MSSNQFTKSNPAKNIDELISYLSECDEDYFVYRGQTRAWQGPLLPSAFRLYKSTNQVFRRPNTLPFTSMRNAGSTFHGLEPLNYLVEFADRYCPTCPLSLPELRQIDDLIDDPWFSLTICGATTFDCIRKSVSQEFDKKFSANYPAWKTVIDHTHRNRIRQFVCLNPFGFIFGMALAQHYGFSSEALDVTHDPLVAAFFATHEFPSYVVPKGHGTGQIFRFRLTEKEYAQAQWQEKDFYTADCFADLMMILPVFEDESYTYHDSISNLADHVFASLEGGVEGRRQHRIRIGAAEIGQTRVGRQKAAILFPDMLLKEEQIAGMKIQRFMAVEDLTTRPDTETFYFHHSKNDWPFMHVTREHLWPRHDIFVDMFEYVLSSTSTMVVHPSGMALPKRSDLIDRGYDT